MSDTRYEPRDDPHENDWRAEEDAKQRREDARSRGLKRWYAKHAEFGVNPDEGLYDAFDVDPDIGDR